MERESSLTHLQVPSPEPLPELNTRVYMIQPLIYPWKFEPSNGYPPGKHIYRHTLCNYIAQHDPMKCSSDNRWRVWLTVKCNSGVYEGWMKSSASNFIIGAQQGGTCSVASVLTSQWAASTRAKKRCYCCAWSGSLHWALIGAHPTTCRNWIHCRRSLSIWSSLPIAGCLWWWLTMEYHHKGSPSLGR
jgi:hypothetical protein